MDSDRRFIVIWTIITLLFGLTVCGYMLYINHTLQSNDCLRLKAINYCNEKNLVYDTIMIYPFKITIRCSHNRELKHEEFKFLESELKECKW
jgi:hypothetical protein